MKEKEMKEKLEFGGCASRAEDDDTGDDTGERRRTTEPETRMRVMTVRWSNSHKTHSI